MSKVQNWESNGNHMCQVGTVRRHLETRAKSIWRAQVFVGLDKDKKRRMSLTRTIQGTKRHAEDVMRQLLVEVGAGAYATTEGSVAELVGKWLRYGYLGLKKQLL